MGTEGQICSTELLARGRANDWTAARRERLQPEAWPLVRPSFQVDEGATVFTIGSCFARNVEEHLAYLGCRIPTLEYRAPQNEVRGGRSSRPFTKYTPADIHQELAWAASIYGRDGRPTEADSQPFAYPDPNGDLRDLALAGCRLAVSPARFYERRRDVYRIWEQVFRADCVVMTLGLIEAWFDRTTGCALIAPPFFAEASGDLERYELRILEYEECLSLTQASLDLIRRYNPEAKFLVTTSPVPLEMSFSSDDILVANGLSKATLRAVCGTVVRNNAGVDYFPSYENVTLTRSWDVMDEDQHQVAPSFVAKIVTRLARSYFGCAGDARLLTQRAYGALDDGASKRALELATLACETDAEIAHAWLARSEACWRLGLLEEAAGAAERGIELAPEDRAGYWHLIDALLALDRNERAASAAESLVGLDGDGPRSLWMHGRARDGLGDVQGAEASYRRAFELQRATPQYSASLLSALRRSGRHEEALELHEWAVSRFPRNLSQRLELARELAAAGRAEEARTRIEQGLGHASSEPERRRLESALVTLGAGSWTPPSIEPLPS